MKVTEETKATAQQMLNYWAKYNRHEQSDWVGSLTPRITVETNGDKVCHTTMCAAGTAVFLTSTNTEFRKFAKVFDDDAWQALGAERLGLNEDEAIALFYDMNEDEVKVAVQAIAVGSEAAFQAVLRHRLTGAY